MKIKKDIAEGINDKNLFKCVFLAGGAGSGKSFIVDNAFAMGSGEVSAFGVKIVNSDKFFELGLHKAGIPLKIDFNNKEIWKQQMAIRKKAKELSKSRKAHLINGMLPIIIDGTGKNREKILRQADEMRSIGYDTSLIFVDTSLAVSLKRNAERKRSVDSDLVRKMWKDVQKNIPFFDDYFKDDFYIIENNKYFPPGSEEGERFLSKLFKIGKSIIESPLENSLGKSILDTLRRTGGKYLTDLEEKKESIKKDEIIEIQDEVTISNKKEDIILEKGDKIRVLSDLKEDNAIPQENLTRAFVREEPSNSSLGSSYKDYGLHPDDLIGWFANTYNMAYGWFIFKVSDFDKREFGSNVFRTYSEKTNTTNIVKFNLLKGTYAFIDDQAYLEDEIVFERMTKYNRLFIEPTQTAFEEFNIF